jgi:hypothetical protein
LFKEPRIGLADAIGVVHLVSRYEQSHGHAVVVVGEMLADSTYAVGFFDGQGFSTRGVECDTKAFASESNSGIQIGTGTKILN